MGRKCGECEYWILADERLQIGFCGRILRMIDDEPNDDDGLYDCFKAKEGEKDD